MRNPSVRDIVDIGNFQHSWTLILSHVERWQVIFCLANRGSPGKQPQLWYETLSSRARVSAPAELVC
jgi:hypothetical protein